MRAQTRQAAQFHWDKRGKKYVRLQAGETVKAGKRVRTESGAKVGSGSSCSWGVEQASAGFGGALHLVALHALARPHCGGPHCVQHSNPPARIPALAPQGKATTGLYEKWSKKTRLRVAPGGAEEAGERLAAQMSDR